MTLEEFVHASLKATTVEDLFALYQRAMAELGLDRLIFSLMTDHASIGRKAGHGIISNYPDEWMKYYLERNFAPLDPVRAGMFSTVGPFLWGEMETTQPLTRAQMLFMNEGREAGLHHGVGVPLRGINGAIAGIGAASTNAQIDLDPLTLSKVHLLSHQFYACFLNLEKPVAYESPPKLTDREREILQYTAHGLSRKQIAHKLGLSEGTVNIHHAHIREKFGTGNILVAAIRALSMYLIQL